MKKEIRFDTVSRYKDFVNERDKTLEHIYRNNRLEVTDIINDAFIKALTIIQSKYSRLSIDHFNKQLKKDVDHEIDQVFDNAVRDIVVKQLSLRRVTFMLAHAGEVEAIARVTGKKPRIALNNNDLNEKSYKPLADGTHLYKRVEVYFNDVRRKMMSALEFSLLTNETVDQALGRAFMAMPRKRALPLDKTALKKVKKAKLAEANKPKFTGESGTEIAFGPKGGITQNVFDLVDMQGTERFDSLTWDEVLRKAAEEYKPIDRSPASFFDLKNPMTGESFKDIDETDKIYSWELEQQLTHDFVASVRDGQIDAANVNGINEFMWISVLDDRTCEKCCEWRSGLMTSEIEKVLADDKDLAEHCDVVVPPAHFNCRCGIAPVAIDNISDLQKPEITKDFDAWLNGE